MASAANPTGTMLARAELAALAQALRAGSGHVVVDEIHHGLSYGIDAPSVLEVDDDAYVLNRFSKYFGMAGWRLGWLVAARAVGACDTTAALQRAAFVRLRPHDFQH